jgi:hypothetical protein
MARFLGVVFFACDRLQMELDLSSRHVKEWRGRLAPNVMSAIVDDATPDGDVLVGGMVAELQSAAPRRVLSVFDRHADAIAGMGRARRVRLMAWMVNRFWPDTNIARDLMREGEGEGEGQGGDGRSKIAPLFRVEYEALMAIVKPYVVNNTQSHETVGALHAGIMDFSRSSETSMSGM